MNRRAQAAAREALSRLLSGNSLLHAIAVAASLGIADLLERGPKSVAALSRRTATHTDSLYRLLRALSAAGVFRELRGRRFALTPMSDLLRTGAPHSLRSVARLAGEEWRRAAFNLASTVRTGRPAFDHEFGTPFYEYLAAHRRQRRLFADVMTYSWQASPTIVGSYDFSGARTIVDIGGGSGAMMESILRRHRKATGVIVDRPWMAAETRRRLRGAGVNPRRCKVVAGDFFAPLPRGADLYVVAFVLHNWDDRRAVAILRRCRQAMAATAKLLVIESPIEDRPSFAAIHDLEMLLCMPGGRERSLVEYRRLFASAGLRVTRVIRSPTSTALIEGVRR